MDRISLSLACSDIDGAVTPTASPSIIVTPWGSDAYALSSAAVKDNWEAEAGWTLRSLLRGQHPEQAKEAFIDPARIIDPRMPWIKKGNLSWNAPR